MSIDKGHIAHSKSIRRRLPSELDFDSVVTTAMMMLYASRDDVPLNCHLRTPSRSSTTSISSEDHVSGLDDFNVITTTHADQSVMENVDELGPRRLKRVRSHTYHDTRSTIRRIERSVPALGILKLLRSTPSHAVASAFWRDPRVISKDLSRNAIIKIFWRDHTKTSRSNLPSELAVNAFLLRIAGARRRLVLPIAIHVDTRSPYAVFHHHREDAISIINKFVKNRSRTPLWLVQSVAVQLLKSVQLLHHHGVLHRDLKPDNVLLDGHFESVLHTDAVHRVEARLCDFGTLSVDPGTVPWAPLSEEDARPEGDRRGRRWHPLVGTFVYMAPEVWADVAFSKATDVWGVGQVLFYMLEHRVATDAILTETMHRSARTGSSVGSLGAKVASTHRRHHHNVPWDARRRLLQARSVIRGHRAPWLHTPPCALRDAVDMMLRVNPGQRPSVRDLLMMLE